MKTKIVKIGNSRGVRIPKSFIEESGLQNEVELEINDGRIIIKPISKPRETWSMSFRSSSTAGERGLLDSEALMFQSRWDEEEWEW